jgi:hypothetical protein
MMALFKGVESGTISGWVLVAIALTSLLTFLAVLVKVWPKLRELTISENETLRRDRRADYKELRAEMDIMRMRHGLVERHCTAVDVRLGQLEFILGMALDELDRLDSGNHVAKKAREMFGRLYPVPPITEELEALRHKLDPLESPIPPRPVTQMGAQP